MAITTDRATSFIAECFQGIHLTTDVYKLALIKPGHAGTYSHATTNVGTPGTGTPTTANLGTDEASGTGYTSGGMTLAAPSITVNGRVTRMDFAAPTPLASATLSAVGAVIYNSTKANRVIGVYDFGGTITSTGAAFTINVPAVGDATSLVRVS
jgi:hypothetical protein